MTREATVLIVPGLRDHAPEHWQTLLASRVTRVRTIAPMGRGDLDCKARIDAIEGEAANINGPIILVAHSGGVIAAVHWARLTQRAVHGALLATPADFEEPLPDGYPSMKALENNGWLPVPRCALPFRSIVAASRNDPLARYERISALALAWGSRLVDLGEVGHLNPDSGFGDWPQADAFINELNTTGAGCAAAPSRNCAVSSLRPC
jgi:predicted alpha/beta hydrolase family esterase